MGRGKGGPNSVVEDGYTLTKLNVNCCPTFRRAFGIFKKYPLGLCNGISKTPRLSVPVTLRYGEGKGDVLDEVTGMC